MKWAAFLLIPIALSAAASLDIFGHQWSVYNPSDWKVTQENGAPLLRLITPREPLPGPRRPFQFAIAQLPDYGSVTVEADMRPLQRSLMIVFSYRDSAHFDYAHLSIDTGIKQPHHNGIFHVYGGERVRISLPDGPPAFAHSGAWYHVKLAHDAQSGEVSVNVDGHSIPALHAADLSLPSGKVGLGSFDETAEFKNVSISGAPAAR